MELDLDEVELELDVAVDYVDQTTDHDNAVAKWAREYGQKLLDYAKELKRENDRA